MFDGFAVVVVSVLLAGLGVVIGSKVGDELSKRVVTVREYRRFIALIMVAGVLASMCVVGTGFMVLATFVIGMIAGAISGLRMGFGEPTGFWLRADRFFSVQKRVRPDASTREKARRARKTKTAQPELMSVDMQGESTKNTDCS